MKRVFIDFDSTLFDTGKLKTVMLEGVAKKLCEKKQNVAFDEVLAELKDMFCREKIYNIFKLCEYFADKYEIDKKCLLDEIDSILKNGDKLLFADSIGFLKMLAQKDCEINILTYVTVEDHDYQMRKIMGSGISELATNILICSKDKGELGLNYQDKNLIFIDDNPKDLVSLFKAGVSQDRLFRIKRVGAKYSAKVIDEFLPMEFESLKDIKID